MDQLQEEVGSGVSDVLRFRLQLPVPGDSLSTQRERQDGLGRKSQAGNGHVGPHLWGRVTVGAKRTETNE